MEVLFSSYAYPNILQKILFYCRAVNSFGVFDVNSITRYESMNLCSWLRSVFKRSPYHGDWMCVVAHLSPCQKYMLGLFLHFQSQKNDDPTLCHPSEIYKRVLLWGGIELPGLKSALLKICVCFPYMAPCLYTTTMLEASRQTFNMLQNFKFKDMEIAICVNIAAAGESFDILQRLLRYLNPHLVPARFWALQCPLETAKRHGSPKMVELLQNWLEFHYD